MAGAGPASQAQKVMGFRFGIDVEAESLEEAERWLVDLEHTELDVSGLRGPYDVLDDGSPDASALMLGEKKQLLHIHELVRHSHREDSNVPTLGFDNEELLGVETLAVKSSLLFIVPAPGRLDEVAEGAFLDQERKVAVFRTSSTEIQEI